LARHELNSRLLTLAIATIGAVLALGAVQARAVILPAITLDGPSEDIVGFGGVAMAEDGTGGVVYLKRVNGVAHVFVSRYVGGRWLAPMQVDTEDQYAASWPRIGAADGGELVVVWATPFATSKDQPIEELLSSTLGAGSSTFGPATVVDQDVGEGTGLSPDLSMGTTGQADVVYRVIESSDAALLRPGDVAESVRVARFDGERWSDLGEVNRDPGLGMRPPTSANAPQIAIGVTGNAVVVWQEPEITGVARIWARRIFGQSLDYVMPVTATSLEGSPITEDAEAPTLAISRLGQAEVAYRQDTSPGATALPGPRIFLNILPDGESQSGAEFLGAKVADPQVPGGSSALVGRPCIDIDEKQDVRLLYDANGEPRVVEGNDLGLTGTLALGPKFVGSALTPSNELPCASVMNPAGGGISAWPSEESQGATAVAVREDFPAGGVQTGLVSGGAGGPIGELAVGRSGLGDGLVAFQQGQLGDAAIVASQVTAPPDTFVTSVPKGWVKPNGVDVSWEPAASANGPLSYSVVLDGHILPTPAGVFSLSVNPRRLGDGVHEVQVLATDMYGQSVLTPPTKLRIDGRPPTVRVKRTDGDTTLLVRVSDSQSGVDKAAISVSFGDGRSAHGRTELQHHYARPGVYEVVIHVRDNLGNQGVVREPVSVA